MNAHLSPEDPKPDLSAKGIWQRLPQEPVSSYAAFCTYLEMGPDSTLQEVAEKLGRPATAVRQLSRRHHWMERAAAHRQHIANSSLLAAQYELAKQAELSRMRDRIFRQQIWETSQTMLIACQESLNELMFSGKPKIPAYELAGMINLCLKLGSRASEPGQFTCEGSSSSNPDFDAAVEKVYGEDMTKEQLIELINTLPSSRKPTPPTGAAPPSTPSNPNPTP